MEQLNKVELKGIVGSVYVKTFGNSKVTNFSLATNFVYTQSNGTPVIETTWHRVVSWDCPEIEKGARVYVLGRLRSTRYTDIEGISHTSFEVIANEVTLL